MSDDGIRELKPGTARRFIVSIGGDHQVVVDSSNTGRAIPRRLKSPFMTSRETREAEKRFVVVKRVEDKAVETFVYKDLSKKPETKRSFWSRLGLSR